MQVHAYQALRDISKLLNMGLAHFSRLHPSLHLLPSPCVSIVPARVMVVIRAKDGSGAHCRVCAPRGKHIGLLVAGAHEGEKLLILPDTKL